MIFAAQLWTGIFAAIGAGILFTMLRKAGPVPAAVISALVFCYGLFLNETMNGMEMTALAVAALAIAGLLGGSPQRVWPVIALFAALVPWIRIEAAAYVVAGAVVMLLCGRGRRHAYVVLSAVVVSLVVMTAMRLAIFDDVLPNTVAAKRHPPYTGDLTILERISRSRTVVQGLLYVLAPAAVLFVVSVGPGGIRPVLRPPTQPIAAVDHVRRRSVDPTVAFAGGRRCRSHRSRRRGSPCSRSRWSVSPGSP